LKALHSKNIIHLGIKPKNIFITSSGTYKIGLFILFLMKFLNFYNNNFNLGDYGVLRVVDNIITNVGGAEYIINWLM
jgi:serine/threonine protein kinase